MSVYNPFTNRRMITKEHEFVGRIREIDDILPRIRTGNSVSIVGERRIGKSSLLYHLYLTGNKRLDDSEKKRFKFIYLDFLDPLLKTPKSFVETIFEDLEIPFKNESDPLIQLAKQCRKLNEKQVLPVLLLDEFEEITKRKDLFNDDFIDGLRSFCNSGNFVLVTASKYTLKSITDKGGLTSPFWNIFANVPIGEFAFDDILNEQALFLTKFWSKDYALEPTENEKKFLISFPSRHPIKIQIISYWLLSNRKLKYSDEFLLNEIEREYTSYFREEKEKVKIYLRKNLPKFPTAINWTTEFLGKQLKNVADIRNYL